MADEERRSPEGGGRGSAAGPGAADSDDPGADPVPLLQGTLDMLILRTLAWGPNHGFGVLRHIEEVTDERLQVEEGALYPALHRMHRKGWLEAEWGVSENNRRARFYRLTPAGERELRHQRSEWGRTVEVIARVLEGAPAAASGEAAG